MFVLIELTFTYFRCHLAHKKVKNVNKAVGPLAKTDTLDARIIARYAAVIKPAAQTAAEPRVMPFRGLQIPVGTAMI